MANIVNEAALLAARKNKRLVTLNEFEEARDKVMMGSERRSMVMTEDEKKLTLVLTLSLELLLEEHLAFQEQI